MGRSCSLVRFSVPSNKGTDQATNDSASGGSGAHCDAAQITCLLRFGDAGGTIYKIFLFFVLAISNEKASRLVGAS